ncbi:MAG TPA: hypothetical protein IAA98_04695 [Candidatus Avipropionibacterium avicola]|uniref:Anti-sigma factor n=1 Tax=Candidatus Avipropionibacterium avicola TaxID=2840701 RepID=A0A9D1GWV4_9ACTN|nr:hypothetical protein [Candidatus Avipropionibacterium avicola]
MNHLTTDELTALADGTLPDDRIDHLADCDQCGEHLSEVAVTLSSVPAPPVPADVAARLADVVEAESRRRTSGEAERADNLEQAAHAKRLSLGSFGDNSPRRALAEKLQPGRRVHSR